MADLKCPECDSTAVRVVEVRRTRTERPIIACDDDVIEVGKPIETEVLDSMGNEDFLYCRAGNNDWETEADIVSGS